MEPITPAQLADFPGAPFSQTVVDAAVARLERELGWHVAPSRTETVTVRHEVSEPSMPELLILPSRYVTEVVEVRGPTGAAVPSAMLTTPREAMLEGRWSTGRYEVDLTHGFDDVPADLLPLVAMLCNELRSDASLKSWSSGPFSATVRAHGGVAMSETFLAYSVNLGV